MKQKIQLTVANSLRKLEGYFQTDIYYIITNSSWLTIGQICAIISAFGMSLFMANFVSKDVYGTYKFILSATGIIGTLSLTGLGTAVTQAVTKGYEGTLFEAKRANLRWGAVTLIVSLGISIYYYLMGNTLLSLSILIAGLSIPLINSYGLYMSFLGGKKKFKQSTLYWTISQAVNMTAVIMAAILTHNALWMTIAYFLTNTISSIFFYRHTIEKEHPNELSDKELISYGKHVSIMNFIGTVANQMDKILVFHFMGSIQLAIYSFATAIPEQIKGSYKNLFNIALPKYSGSTDDDALHKSIKKKTFQLTLITVLIVAVYIILSPLIFKTLFPQYLDAVFYSQVYMLGLISIPGLSLMGIYFQVKKDTKVLYKITAISNISTIILTIILIYNFGVLGAVIENGVSWLIILLSYLYFFNKERN